MTWILAIDPGTTHSGWVLYADGQVRDCGVLHNQDVLELIRSGCAYDLLALEMVASYGMPVGAEVFRTVWWTGRFAQVSVSPIREVFRKDVKSHLCGSQKAKDANVRQALIDRYGGKAEAIGTVKKQGPLYRVKSHAWPALAVAITAAET
jgi:hypothetical protein